MSEETAANVNLVRDAGLRFVTQVDGGNNLAAAIILARSPDLQTSIPACLADFVAKLSVAYNSFKLDKNWTSDPTIARAAESRDFEKKHAIAKPSDEALSDARKYFGRFKKKPRTESEKTVVMATSKIGDGSSSESEEKSGEEEAEGGESGEESDPEVVKEVVQKNLTPEEEEEAFNKWLVSDACGAILWPEMLSTERRQLLDVLPLQSIRVMYSEKEKQVVEEFEGGKAGPSRGGAEIMGGRHKIKKKKVEAVRNVTGRGAKRDDDKVIDDFRRTMPDVSTELINSLPMLDSTLVPALPDPMGMNIVDNYRQWSYEEISKQFDPEILLRYTNLKELQLMFEFQGFNAQATISRFMTRQHVRGAQIDGLACCVIAVERGNNVTNMVKNMAKVGVEYVNKLVQAYNIVNRVSNANSTATTFSRIAISIPQLTCDYMPKARSPTVPFSTMDNLLTSTATITEFPKQMQHAAFAAVVEPKWKVAKKLLGAHMVHQVLFTMQVNPAATRGKGKVAILKDTIRFSKAAMNSTWMTTAERQKCLVKWGLVEMSEGNAISTTKTDEAYTASRTYFGLDDDEFTNILGF